MVTWGAKIVQGHLEAIGGEVGSLAEAADVKTAGSEYRCICGICGLRSLVLIPKDVALDPTRLRRFLWKLKITLKRAEVILSAFGGNFEGAYKRYRVADFHVKFPSTPESVRGMLKRAPPPPMFRSSFFPRRGVLDGWCACPHLQPLSTLPLPLTPWTPKRSRV